MPNSKAGLQSILWTTRLCLIPLSPAHFEHLALLDGDPEVMRFVGNGRARSRDEVLARCPDYMARALPVAGLGMWIGFLRASGLQDPALVGPFVGWWLLQPPQQAHQKEHQEESGHAELGYRLIRSYWRQGFAKEGSRELLRHGFEDLQLRSIFAETMAVNEASRATMVSVGMTHARTFFLDFGNDTIAGAESGEVGYRITKREWEAANGTRPSDLP